MLFSRDDRLVTPKIVQPTSGGWKWWFLLALIPLLAWSWYIYDYGRKQAGFDSAEAQQQVAGLRQEIGRLNKQLEGLRLQSASFERSGQIDRQAAQDAQQEFRILQQEQAELKKEVAFLNGLLTDKNTSAVLRMKNFRLARLNNSGYELSFMVVQLTKVGGIVEGELDIEVSGTLDGKASKLSLSDMTEKKLDNFKLRFKNFQKFEAELVLPENFQPEAVIISTQLKSKKIEALEETRDWVISDAD